MSISMQGNFAVPPAGYGMATAPMGAPGAGAPIGYQPDGFAARYGIQTSASTTVKQPVASIVDDPGAASRFSHVFIKSSEGLLKVGGDGGAFGRFFLNVLAGAVPLFTPKARREEIAANVMNWVGRADLVRSGCSPTDARTLQASGISNITDLARMTNPMDQMTLVGRMQMTAMQWGWPAPSLSQVAGWVATAQTLPPRFN